MLRVAHPGTKIPHRLRAMLTLSLIGALTAACGGPPPDPSPTAALSPDQTLVPPLPSGPGIETPAPETAEPTAATSDLPSPTSDLPSPTSATASPLAPGATPMEYVVEPGDTFSGIAQRFGLTVAELLAANPSVADPNLIQLGSRLLIPPPGGISGIPAAVELSDARGDVRDPDDEPAFAPSYVDIVQFGARFAGQELIVGIRVGAAPPALDPAAEVMEYLVKIDVTGDGEPDYELLMTNETIDDQEYALELRDLASGEAVGEALVAGSVELVGDTIRGRVSLEAVGQPLRASLAAVSRREFYPSGREGTAQTAVDRAPDQQHPRRNADWVEIAIR